MRVHLAKEVVQVIKQNENLIRDIVEKRNVIIFGFKEKVLSKKNIREEEEKNMV